MTLFVLPWYLGIRKIVPLCWTIQLDHHQCILEIQALLTWMRTTTVIGVTAGWVFSWEQCQLLNFQFFPLLVAIVRYSSVRWPESCLPFLLFCKGNEIDLDRNKLMALFKNTCKLCFFKFWNFCFFVKKYFLYIFKSFWCPESN
jgi:hypothetical protein